MSVVPVSAGAAGFPNVTLTASSLLSVLFSIDHDSIANLQVFQRRVSGALHVEWFKSRCEVVPSFSDARIGVLQFGAFTLILDAASDDSVATIGFNSVDCNADFAALGSAARESWNRRKIALMVLVLLICRGLVGSRSGSSSCFHPPYNLIKTVPALIERPSGETE
jgi:hypothetical protein